LREFFADGESAGFGTLSVSRCQTVEKEHGRIETRQSLWINDLSWLDRTLREHWPKLAGVGVIERQQEINGRISFERVLPVDEAIALYAGKASIEKKLPMADALIYATAILHEATIFTQDAHFEGLPQVKYFAKA